MKVTAGASQSLAEKPGRPSSLSCAMFADRRHRNTVAVVMTATATTVTIRCRPVIRHVAAAAAAIAPLIRAVTAMWVLVKPAVAARIGAAEMVIGMPVTEGSVLRCWPVGWR